MVPCRLQVEYVNRTLHGAPRIMEDPVYSRSIETTQARLLAGLCGPMLLGLGSGISVSAGFGAFGFSVLLDGIYTSSALPLWVSQVMITLLFYAVAGAWAGIPLGAGTLPSLLLIGPAISFGATVTPDSLGFAGNLLAFVVGLLLFALGISLAAAAKLGPDGITALCLAAEKRINLPIPHANFLLNFTAIIIGIWLSGRSGPATLAGLLVVPVLIKHMLPSLRHWLATA